MSVCGIVPVASTRLWFSTTEPIQFMDITDMVSDQVRRHSVHHGLVTVFSRHTTAAIRIQENEPLLLQDLQDLLCRLLPPGVAYHHDNMLSRTVHMHTGERANGRSHCLQFLLGTSETVPVVDGELQLGTWQRVFLVELDGPRPAREVVVQVIGSPGAASEHVGDWLSAT